MDDHQRDRTIPAPMPLPPPRDPARLPGPGWYRTPGGRVRFWDGRRWTSRVVAGAPAPRSDGFRTVVVVH